MDYTARPALKKKKKKKKVKLDFLSLMSRSLPAEVLFVCIETKNYDYGTLAL